LINEPPETNKMAEIKQLERIEEAKDRIKFYENFAGGGKRDKIIRKKKTRRKRKTKRYKKTSKMKRKR
jgi:hypothetical protein